MIKIEIEIEPVAKGRPRFTKQGHAYTPAKTKNYEKNNPGRIDGSTPRNNRGRLSSGYNFCT